jgi:hypothetical protein
MARSLQHILVMIYRAGARDVPGESLPWTAEDFPEINRAMNMSYIIRRERNGRSFFSLTRAGYHAIDQQPLPMTLAEIAKNIALWFFFGRV